MATAVVSTGFSQVAFDAFLAARDEPSWLVEMRRAAWRRFLELPMPSVREEEWMRTDIRLFKLDRFNLPEADGDHAAADVPQPHAMLAAGVELGGRGAAPTTPVAAGADAPRYEEQWALFGGASPRPRGHG